MTRDKIISILQVGITAASAYNSQPWRFVINGDQVSIFLRKLSNNGLAGLSQLNLYNLGCLLENIREGALHHGHHVKIKVTGHSLPSNQPAATVVFSSTSSTPHSIDHVLNRHTNRHLYHDTPVPTEILAEIKELYATATTSVIDVGHNKEFIRTYASIERIRYSNRVTSDEVFENIISNHALAQVDRESLDGPNIPLPSISRYILQITRWRFLRWVARHLVIPTYLAIFNQRKILMHAPSLLVFTQNNHNPTAVVIAWMKIQRTMNLLQKHGLSSQVVSSGGDMLKINRDIYTSRQRIVIERLAAQLEGIIGQNINDVMTVVRIGYAEPTEITRRRRDIEDFLL